MTELHGHDAAAPDEQADSADDLDLFLAEQMQDPEFRGHFEDAQTRHELFDGLVAARADASLTQAEVATRMGTTQSAVSEIEGGASDPRVSTLQRYARAVGACIFMQVIPEQATYSEVTVKVGADELRWSVGASHYVGNVVSTIGDVTFTTGLTPEWLAMKPLGSGFYLDTNLLSNAIGAPEVTRPSEKSEAPQVEPRLALAA